MSTDHAETTALGRTTSPTDVQLQRDQLRDAMVGLEDALARPSTGRAEGWRDDVRSAVAVLHSALVVHEEVTEGSGGLLADIVAAAPHLEHAVGAVRAEHDRIDEQLEQLTAGLGAMTAANDTVDDVRGHGLELLGTLARHRQRGIELTYQAFASDLGASE